MNRLLLIGLKNLFRLPGVYSRLCRYAQNPEKYPEAERWAYTKGVLELAIRSGNIDLQVTGVENIPTEPGFMMYGNHQGLFDVLAIGATCPMPLGIVYKKELKDVPVLKQILTFTKSFAMDREDVRQSLTVIQNVTKEVEAGRNYVIFPEGTRSKQGNTMGDFHGGSFRCAVKAKCPVVPMALIDCFQVLDQKGSKKVSAQLHYLPAIPYEEYEGMKAAELAELVKSRIQACIEEHTAVSS